MSDYSSNKVGFDQLSEAESQLKARADALEEQLAAAKRTNARLRAKAYLYRIGDSLTDELNSKIDERRRAASLEEAKRLSDKQELAERALLAELKAKYE